MRIETFLQEQSLLPERKNETIKCEVCRGFARFCKISTCPFYRNVLKEVGLAKISSDIVFGSSPPTVIVGEKGYPRVWVGPTVSLIDQPQTTALDNPSEWLEASIEDLLKIRLTLLYGRAVKSVKTYGDPYLQTVQETSSSVKPVDIELATEGELSIRPGFGVRAAPHGPSAKIKKIKIASNVSIPRRVDSMINDPYVSSVEAVIQLYSQGFDEYYLMRLFSAGLLGRSPERKLVPTEWSITAVDDILSRKLYQEVRKNNVIPEFRVYSYEAVENAAHIILTPTPWMYELLEGWLKHAHHPTYSDHEYLKPRTTYAENTGGAYYAVRFSILRHMKVKHFQAGAIVFFEILPGWIPLGVWRFREIVRVALTKPAEKHQTFEEALETVSRRLRIPMIEYVKKSWLINYLRKQQLLS